VIGPRVIFLGTALITTVVSFMIPLLAEGYPSAWILFFAAAGTYTPGLMMIASRFAPVRRGSAVGYGFSALGDSPVFSTGLTEVVPAARLGTALAVRSLLDFGVGAAAPAAFEAVLDLYGGRTAPPEGWGWAFSSLGLSGVLGLASALWLRALPASRVLAGGKR
jgi:hypothetical protein